MPVFYINNPKLYDSRPSSHQAHVVAVISEFVVVKRIARNRLLTDNYITLRSDNESYGEMTVALADIRALFKAKRIISSPIR